MRQWLTGTTALALGCAAPAVAQSTSPIDTLEPAATETIAPPAPTGDPVVDRLNALEAKLQRLEAKNRELEDELELSRGRIASVEVRAAKGVQPGVSPTLADNNGVFSFKSRGVIDVDYAHFGTRAGGYDFNDGTGFRRARLGFEGTAFKDFLWRIEVDFAGNVVTLQDAYLSYAGYKNTVLTLGQFKAPFGLESNNSDNYNTFIERGMFTNAFGTAGAERRIGAQAAYQRDNFTVAAGFFGDNESIGRSTGAPLTNAPHESIGVNARATWEPLNQPGRIVHIGAAGFWRSRLKSGDVGRALRLTERPNIRVDNGNIIDTGVIPGVDNLYYAGAEATLVHGPFSLTGEFGRLYVDRLPGLPDTHFDGGYVYGSWFVTGETRAFRTGNFDRIRPLSPFSNKGGTGAVELAVRYDTLDVGSTPVAARLGTRASSLTAGLNWYLTPNFKLQFNYIRFEGDNTPLDPVGAKTKGDAVATRLHLDW